MIESIDYEGNNASEDGYGDTYGGDRCPGDNNGTDIPSGAVSPCFLNDTLKNAHLISDSRTL